MKKNGIIIGIILAILVIIIIAILFFMNRNKEEMVYDEDYISDEEVEDEEETGAFNGMSVTIGDYIVNIDSEEVGHPETNSYFTTSVSTVNDEGIESYYTIKYLDIIDSNKTPYDSKFEVFEEDTITINDEEYKYYIDRSGWNAILCYTIPGENKDLVININGGDVFASNGTQIKTMAIIDEEFLNSDELAGVLNFSIEKDE